MFIGDFEKAAAWSDNAVKGCKRFLDRVWNLHEGEIAEGTEYSAASATGTNGSPSVTRLCGMRHLRSIVTIAATIPGAIHSMTIK